MRSRSSSRNATAPTPNPFKLMITLTLGTVILALTYGAFWHNQPARRQKDDRGNRGFRPSSLVTRVLEWLVVMPHVSDRAEKTEPFFLTRKCVIPDRQTRFFRQVLRAFLGWNLWPRILGEHAEMRPSIPADLFKTKANTNELPAGKTT